MHFAENLKQIRKEHHLSQEELAELLDVSRQAVSKWEQGQGYPEVEKLLLLAEKLNVSLDVLMSTGKSEETSKKENRPGMIIITSPNENAIVDCYKVVTSGKMRGGPDAPKYALFGVGRGRSNLWGEEPTTFLGWYADHAQISKEVEEISKAIAQGVPTYTLQYSARTERRWASVKIVE